MTSNEAVISGRRILIVEDNFTIAAAMARILKARGAEIIGPAGTVSDALALVAVNEIIDGAALDINLRGKMVYPVVDLLRARNVPMVFMTGYDEEAIEASYAEIPCMQKPVTIERLMHALFG
jgi:two-component SAPR family response regulator